jgi:hypothetical protein
VAASSYALLPGACPAPCFPGHDSCGISRRMASHPRKPGGRDLAEVALSGPPMTTATPLGPTKARNGIISFFEYYP